MKVKQGLCYKSAVLQMLGITNDKFQLLGIQPVKEVANPHYRSGAVAYLYDKEQVQSLVGTPEIEALKPKPRKPKDYGPVFNKRYKTEVEVFGAGCDALFNLNRYCKHPECSGKNRDEIYDLKNRFIRLLYTKGYCASAHIYRWKRAAYGVDCYQCDGYGCERCGHTGVYKIPERVKDYVVFRFNVNGVPFVWHQSKEHIDYHVGVSDRVGELNETEVKRLSISKAKLSESKALLKWILHSYHHNS